MNPVLTIDPEFEAKCPPLTEDELSQLEENILEEGLVLMPLIVWNDTIVDGHNRYRIAQAHPGIGFRTHEKQFSNRYEALSWICKNQLGRRNLTPQQKKYLIGQRYDAEKKTHGGDRKSNLPESSGQNDHLIAAQNWAIFKDVHEPIIERAVFEQVQQKRGKMRKRQAKDGERSMFSGLLVCADCGSNLHFHFNQGNPEIKYFNCSNYKGNRGTCGSTHYVRVDFLEQVVLGEIRRLTKYAGLYEDDFLKEVIGHSRQAEETERRLKEKELKSLLARDDELDGLFERIYEDNVSGKLSDDRFAKMSRRYEEEQKELSEKIKKLRSEIEKQSSRATSTDMFVSIVRKYTRARKLTPRMLNELVEKIEVYNAEKIDGEWVQRLRIHYNCVGEMNIPNEPALSIPAVTVNTRKGVFVSYTTDDRPAV